MFESPTTSGAATTLLDCVDDAILVLGEGFDLLYANRAATVLTAGTETEGIVDPWQIIRPDEVEAALDALHRARRDGIATVRLHVHLPTGPRPVEVTLTDHTGTDGIGGVVACFRNLENEEALRASLDEQRRTDRRLMDALTDDLTGLPMRRLFIERLERALARAREHRQPLTVAFIDLDGFKAINDALGHSAGDAMLRATSERLLREHPCADNWGRIGGDEFVLFVEATGGDDAQRLAGRLSSALHRPILLGDRSFHMSASIGVTVVDDGGLAAERAVRHADIAMFEGKRVAPNSVTFFDPEMEHRVVSRAELQSQLRATLTGSGPGVVFQPIVDLRTGATVAVEALARWHSPTVGPIGPDRFVTMSEQMGVVDQLDRHVLRRACREIGRRTDPVSGLPLDLTVNTSTMHIGRPHAAERMLGILDDQRFPAHRLIVEITESIAIEDDAVVREQIEQLRDEGVRIAIDDFGSGHSSLAQLETLDIDYVKIDRSFLYGVPDNHRRMRYIESIIAMTYALDVDVIFEGIEHAEQAQALRRLDVTLGQGYFLSPPAADSDLDDRMMGARDTTRAMSSGSDGWQPVLGWIDE